MPKPSEIFDTPEAFSRVGDNKKPLRICNKTGVHTCRLGSIHLNEREALILNDYLTTKDQEKEEAIRAERARIVEIIKDELRNAPLEVQMTKGIIFANVINRIEALPTEDNK